MKTIAGRTALLAGLLLLAGACGGPTRGAEDGAIDLMVFAPHPDDETLGCAGILLQALRRGERVKVVLFTNGDGFPAFASLIRRKPTDQLGEEDFRELARFRQSQTLKAFDVLGGRPEDLVFLGYPDSGLESVYQARGSPPVRQKFTGKSETYGPGRPAPYTYDAVLADVIKLIKTLRPRRILVTDEADRHPDHRAAFRFVRDAIQAVDGPREIDTYLIHGGPQWPWPIDANPEMRFEAHEVKGERIPQGVPWPPPTRVALNREEALTKARAIQAHASHLTSAAGEALQAERVYLESFVKSEEVFWRAAWR